MPSPMNSWSLLYEELKMKIEKDNYEHSEYYYDYDRNKPVVLGGVSEATPKDYNDFWGDDGISFTEFPGYAAADTINFGSPIGTNSPDTINLNFNATDSIGSIDLNIENKNGYWKYSEDIILKEVRDYLSGTYRAHYCSQESKTQTLDLIDSIGDAEAFCRSNAIKYLSRFGKKNGKSKFDILKAIHYCILLYHFSGITRNESNPYETF